jgi:integrase
MPKRVTGLTAVQVRTAPPGRYADGDGLYLLVRERGRFWVQRYRLAGRDREIGLGRAGGRGAVTLAQAREAAQQHRWAIMAGKDPIDLREAAAVALEQAAAVAKRDAVTFRAVTDLYLAAHEGSWRNAKHRAQWRATLDVHAIPAFGDKPVAAINTDDVLRVLEPIWRKIPETASRLRGRIEAILDYATARNWRTDANAAKWKGHLATQLPQPSKLQRIEHHAALPWGETGAFMVGLRAQRGIPARALEWTILTAARTGETIGARWEEIDIVQRVWTIPGDRMKAGVEHRVPLSDAAMAVLAAAQGDRERSGGYVFAGGKEGKPLSNMAMAMLLRRIGRPDITAHGFRSAFRDWCAEATDTPREIAEACLAHSIGSKVEAAYRRGDALEKRRRVMEAWAAFCAGPGAAPHAGPPVTQADLRKIAPKFPADAEIPCR